MAKETLKDAKATENVEKKVEVAEEQSAKTESRVLQEAVYSVNELAANAREIFGTRQECVVAALRAADKSECTVSEAKKIVERFLKKEVK